MPNVNRNYRTFHKDNTELRSVRSEGRMKSYNSVVDSRAWSDTEDSRRQYFLEYTSNNRPGSNREELISTKCVVEAMVASKNNRIKQLEKKINYLEKMAIIYSELNLTSEQKQKLFAMKGNLKNSYAELAALILDQEENQSRLDGFSNELAPTTETFYSGFGEELDVNDTDSFVSFEKDEDYRNNLLLKRINQKVLVGGVMTIFEEDKQEIPKGYFAGRYISHRSNTSISLNEIEQIIPSIPNAKVIPPLSFGDFPELDISSEDLKRKDGMVDVRVIEKEVKKTAPKSVLNVKDSEMLKEVVIKMEAEVQTGEIHSEMLKEVVNKMDAEIQTCEIHREMLKEVVNKMEAEIQTGEIHREMLKEVVNKMDAEIQTGEIHSEMLKEVVNIMDAEIQTGEIYSEMLKEVVNIMDAEIQTGEIYSEMFKEVVNKMEAEIQTCEIQNRKESTTETIPYMSGDSILIQTDDVRDAQDCMDQLSQTDDLSNIIFKIHPYTRSPSCPCLIQAGIRLRTTQGGTKLKTNNKNINQRIFSGENNQNQVELKLIEDKGCGTGSEINFYELCKERMLENKHRHQRPTVTLLIERYSKEDLTPVLVRKNAEIIALRDGLKAKESYCVEQKKHTAAALEQLDNIKNVVKERDELRKKLEYSQEEMEKLKNSMESSSISLPVEVILSPDHSSHYEDDISELEQEISRIRAGQLTRELETNVMMQELQILKKYSAQLDQVRKENSVLNQKLTVYENACNKLEISDLTDVYLDKLLNKLSVLDETTNERDTLKVKVEKLEADLSCLKYLPEDIEVFKQRSLLLDDILHDRDRLSKRVEQLRGLDKEVVNLRKKASRVDELEDELRRVNKEKKMAEDEAERLRGKYSASEIELLNQRANGDTLRSKVTCLEHEIENLKSVSHEKERLREERDHLRHCVDELTRMQGDFDHMQKQMKCLEILKAERDMFKSKYEILTGLECECDMLRAQVQQAKAMDKDRYTLESQIEELEACVAEQEAEIRRLVCHIDGLSKSKDDQQESLKAVIINLRADLEKKDHLFQTAEKKLEMLQKELGKSINGLSTETTDLKLTNQHLENCVYNYQEDIQQTKAHIAQLVHDNEDLRSRITDLVDDNNLLMQKLEEKENSLNTLKEVLQDHEVILDEFHKSQLQRKQALRDIDTETDDIDMPQNTPEDKIRNLQEKLIKMGAIAGDKFLQNLLVQSKQAVQRIAKELEKQYKDWDSIKSKLREPRQTEASFPFGANVFTVGYCYCSQGGGGSANKCSCTPKNAERASITPTKKADSRPGSPTNKAQSGASTAMKTTAAGRDKGNEVGSSTADCTCRGISETTNTQTKTVDKLVGSNVCTCKDKGTDQPQSYGKVRGSQTENKKLDKEVDNECICKDGTTQLSAGGTLEFDVRKWSCLSNSQKDEDADTFESARSTDCSGCKSLLERMEILEKELANANDTVLELQEQIDRFTGENKALRQHSVEVQEVAKDEIQDLVGHLKESKDRCFCLESKTDDLIKSKSAMQLEKDQMLKLIKELQNQKADMEKVLASNIVTTTRRTSNQETEIDTLQKANKEFEAKITRLEKCEEDLTKCQDDNKNLKEKLNKTIAELNRVREAADPKEIEALRSENLKLLKKIEAQFKEISILLDKLKTSPLNLEDLPGSARGADNAKCAADKANGAADKAKGAADKAKGAADKVDLPSSARGADKAKGAADKAKGTVGKVKDAAKDKVALKSIANDLEKQMKNLEKLPKIQANDDLNKVIRGLTNRLQDAEKRAGIAEAALGKLKANDATAMLNAEIAKLKQKIADLECEKSEANKNNANKDIKIKQLETEVNMLRSRCDSLTNENSKLEKQNEAQVVKQIKGGTTASLEDYGRLKSELQSLEKEKVTLAGELKNAYDKISKLQEEIGKLKQELVKTQNEVNKMKKDPQSLASAKGPKDLDKVVQLEAEKLKCIQENLSLQKDVDKLRAELDQVLNTSKQSSSAVSSLHNDVASLKLKVDQLEGDNTKLTKDLENAIAASRDANDNLNKYLNENSVLRRANFEAGDQISGLKIQLENAICEAQKSSAQKDADLQCLKDKVSRFEAENDKLSDDLKAAQANSIKCNEELAKLTQKITTLQRKNDKFQYGLGQSVEDPVLHNKLATLEGQNASLNKDLNKALEDLSKSSNALVEAKCELSKVQQKNAMLESDNANLKKEINKVLDESKQISLELLRLRESESSVKQRSAQLESDNLKLKREFDHLTVANKNNSSLVQTLKEENNRLKLDTCSLQQENSKLSKELQIYIKARSSKDEKEIWRQKYLQVDDANRKLKNELDEHRKCPKLITRMENENSGLKKKLCDMELEIDDIRSKYEGAMGDSQRNKVDLERSKTNEKELNALLSRIQNDYNKMRNDLAQSTNTLAESKLACCKFEQRIEILETENQKLRFDLGEYCNLQVTASNLKQDNESMKQRLASLERENARLIKEFDTSLPASQAAAGTGDASTEQLSKYESENRKLKCDLNNALNAVKKNAELQEAEAELKRQIAQLEYENSKVKKDLQEALEDAQKGSKGVSQLQEENSKLKDRINELEFEVSGLNRELDSTLEKAKQTAFGICELQENDARQKQNICFLEQDKDRFEKDLNSAMAEVKEGKELAGKLRCDNVKQKETIAQLQYDIARLKNELSTAAKTPDSTDKVGELSERVKEEQQKVGALRQKLDSLEKEKSQLFCENKSLKSTVQELQRKVDALQEQNNKLSADIAKVKKEGGDRVGGGSALRTEMERTQAPTRPDDMMIKKLQDEIESLNKKLKELQNENRTIKSDLDNALKDAKNKANAENKLKDDISKLKQKIAELESVNVKIKTEADTNLSELSQLKKELNDKVAEAKAECNKEKNEIIKKNQDELCKMKIAHQDNFKEMQTCYKNDICNLKIATDNEIKKLNDSLNKTQQELREATSERDRLKKITENQSKNSKSIKEKVDQVEGLITNERRRSQDEQMKNKNLQRQIDCLNVTICELQKSLDGKVKELSQCIMLLEGKTQELSQCKMLLEGKTQQILALKNQGDNVKDDSHLKFKTEDTKMPDVVAITAPITEQEMRFFGKPAYSSKPHLPATPKKKADVGLEGMNENELQLLHKKLAETTVDRFGKLGQFSGAAKPSDDAKLALLQKICCLEGDLSKKQKQAQQKVAAMQYAVKYEKDRLQYMKGDMERMKSKQVVSEINSQPKSRGAAEQRFPPEKEKPRSPGGADTLSDTESRPKHNKKRIIAELPEKMHHKSASMTSEMLKMKLQDGSQKKSRCRSPNSTPVKDTNLSPNVAFYTSVCPNDKTPKTHRFTRGMASRSSNGLD